MSDYDVAIFGEHLSATNKVLLSHAIDDISTLKKIDLVFVTSNSRQITEEGVVIYEQAQNEVT